MLSTLCMQLSAGTGRCAAMANTTRSPKLNKKRHTILLGTRSGNSLGRLTWSHRASVAPHPAKATEPHLVVGPNGLATR